MVESRMTPSFLFASNVVGCGRIESIVAAACARLPVDPISAAATIMVAVVNERPFARGNEALAVALATDLLLENGFTLRGASIETVREQMTWLFPQARWEDHADMLEPHQVLLYHLARVLADPAQKGVLTVAQEEAAARHLLSLVTVAA